MPRMTRTYKKVELDGEIYIEETRVMLIPIKRYEEQKAEAEELINLEKE